VIEDTMHFVKESRIAAPPATVFAFHESPGAFLRLSPPWEKVELLEGGDSLKPGARAVIRTKVGPFWVKWVAEHTDYEPGRMFADRQIEGPFARWEHRHLFLDDGKGGTRLVDEVDYEPPLGRLLSGGMLEDKLRRLFDFRHEETRRIVESGDFVPRST
jgi:ligand-binding SRPBCC domain-containing protein